MLLVVYVAADRRPKSILYFNFNFQHVIKDTAKTNRVKPRIGALDIHGYEMLGVRSSFSFCFEWKIQTAPPYCVWVRDEEDEKGEGRGKGVICYGDFGRK